MSAESRTTLKAFFETGDTPTQAQFADLIDSFYSLVSDFGILIGKLNQSGTSAPALTAAFSSLSFTPTFSYVGTGEYTMTSVGNLDIAKVFIWISPDVLNESIAYTEALSSPDTISIWTIDVANTPSDGALNDANFLMIVLP